MASLAGSSSGRERGREEGEGDSHRGRKNIHSVNGAENQECTIRLLAGEQGDKVMNHPHFNNWD